MISVTAREAERDVLDTLALYLGGVKLVGTWKTLHYFLIPHGILAFFFPLTKLVKELLASEELVGKGVRPQDTKTLLCFSVLFIAPPLS